MANRYKIIALLLSIFFLVFLPHNNLLNQFDAAFSQKPVLSVSKASNGQVEAAFNQNFSSAKAALLDKLKTDLSDLEEYSVTIYDINGDEFLGINQTKGFHAASVMKVLVATTVFKQIENGTFSLSKPLGDSNVKEEMRQMINQSNNFSWDLLNKLVGLESEQQVANQLGLPGAKISKNQMTTEGITKLLLTLYKGQFISLEHRDLLFSWMYNTETEDRITAVLPKGVAVYHKTGTFDGGVHDAAIVIHPKNPFIVTIFTHDKTGQVDQPASIRQAARDIYNYFDSLSF